MNSIEIAKHDLKNCYSDFGILAGTKHYCDYWTRDAFFGWLGALVVGDTEIVRKHLEVLAKFQTHNGHIPFMVRQNLPLLPFIGIKKKIAPYPKFKSHKVLNTTDVVDSNLYFIEGILAYFEYTKDEKFLASLKTNVLSATNWYTKQLSKHLFSEGLIAQWNDGIYKKGVTLITNLQVYRALIASSKIMQYLEQDYQEFLEKAEQVKSAVLRDFWNGSYLIDWIDNGKKHEYFDTIANMLAIIWDLVEGQKAEKILAFAKTNTWVLPLTKMVYPPYPLNKVEIINLFAGNGDYCRGVNTYWMEPCLLNIWALIKSKSIDTANILFEGVSNLIEQNQGIFEIYTKNSNTFKPSKGVLYQSENPFTRSSGLFVFIESLLKSKDPANTSM